VELNDRIKEARKSAGLTQVQLAWKVTNADGRCVSQASIALLEHAGVKHIKPAYLFQLQDITGFAARWIKTGEGPKRVRPESDIRQLLSYLKTASPEA